MNLTEIYANYTSLILLSVQNGKIFPFLILHLPNCFVHPGAGLLEVFHDILQSIGITSMSTRIRCFRARIVLAVQKFVYLSTPVKNVEGI